ncbi:MAG: DNA polymerase III subunit delta, partial [Sphingomonas sp.]|nr:DNA polymerase III subunit delta [Sphingomonas sp.]
MKANLAQLRAALDRPSNAIRFILLSGPDEAGAREHFDRMARAMGPEAERVELDGATLRQDPGRLAAEAASLSLFGGARFILVSAVGDDALAAFDALLQAPVAGNPVIAIGPGLKNTSKLTKLALASPAALSFVCYVPTGAEAVQLATSIAASHGLRATGEAARRLVATTGGDRALITREVEKLALYLDTAPDRPAPLDDNTLDALGADLNEGEIASAIDAALIGDRALLGAELVKLSASGTSAIPVVRGLVRRLML